jgi:hypothetical protein
MNRLCERRSRATDVRVSRQPIWFALITEHRLLARSCCLARRYPQDVSPLAVLLRPTNDAFADLQRLVSPGEHVARNHA